MIDHIYILTIWWSKCTHPENEPNDSDAAKDVENVRPVAILRHDEAGHHGAEDVAYLRAAEYERAHPAALCLGHPAGHQDG